MAGRRPRKDDLLNFLQYDERNRIPGLPCPVVAEAVEDLRSRSSFKRPIEHVWALQALATQGLWQEALQILEDMTRKSLRLHIRGHNAAMAAAAHCLHWVAALELLHETSAVRLKPNCYSYGVAIRACSRDQVDLVPGLLAQMRRRGLKPDLVVSSALLPAYCKLGRWEEAAALLAKMGTVDDVAEENANFFNLILRARRTIAAQRASTDATALATAACVRAWSWGKPLPWPRPPAAGYAGREEIMPPSSLIRKIPSLPPSSPYAKEFRLLKHVIATAVGSDPESVCKAMEEFGRANKWPKLVGNAGAAWLISVMKAADPRGTILQIGTHCGYAAARMAAALPEAHIATFEVDPVRVIVAKNLLLLAGLEGRVDVWTGHSRDLLGRMACGYGGPGEFRVAGVFMNQKGSSHIEDLDALEAQGLLLPGAVLVADEKPEEPELFRRLFEDRSSFYVNAVSDSSATVEVLQALFIRRMPMLGKKGGGG